MFYLFKLIFQPRRTEGEAGILNETTALDDAEVKRANQACLRILKEQKESTKDNRKKSLHQAGASSSKVRKTTMKQFDRLKTLRDSDKNEGSSDDSDSYF